MNKLLDKYKKIPAPVKAGLWFFICTVLQKGIVFLTVPIFTRLLTTEQYGLLTVYQSWMAIISVFTTLNLSAGVFNNGMIKYPGQKNQFLSSLLGLSTTVTAVFFIVYLMFRQPINTLIELPTVLVLAMFMELFMSPALALWSAKQRFSYKYRAMTAITVTISLANVGVGLLAVSLAEEKGVARVLSAAIVNICAGLVLYVFNMIKGKTFFHKKYWKFALAFNLPLIPHYLSVTILNNSDRVMINKFCGTGSAAIYGVAYSIGLMLNIVMTAINSSYTPWFYQSMAKKEYQKISKLVTALVALLGGVSLLLVTFAPEIIRIMAPASYYEAVWLVPPITLSMFICLLYNVFAGLEFYFEKNIFIMIASCMGALLNIALNSFVIPLWGYIATGYTTLLCFIVWAFAHYIFSTSICKKELGLKKSIFNIKAICFIVLGVFTATAFIMLFYNLAIVRYLIVAVLCFVFIIKRKALIHLIKQMKNVQNKGKGGE